MLYLWNMRIKKSLLLFVALYLSLFSVAQQTIDLPKDGESKHLAKHAWILEDPKNELSIKEILELKTLSNVENAFQAQSEIPYMDFTTSAFWMEINVRNSEDDKRRFILELGRPLTNQIDLYLLNESNSIVKEFHTGDDYVFEERAYDYRKFVFPLEFLPESNYRVLVRAKSDGEILKLPMKFWSIEGFSEFISKENFFLGLYYGFISLVVILFTFFGIALRERIYFFFVSYVFIMGMFQLSLDGFAFEFIWPHSNYLGNHSILIFAAISMLSLLAYANQFLEFHKEAKWFKNLYKFFFGIVCFFLITSFTKGFLYEITFPLLNGISFIVTTFFFVGIYLRYKSGHQPGIEVTLAFAFLWMGAISFILSNVNIIESEFLATNSLKVASAIEIAFLSISLAARYRKTQNDKLIAEQESVERLEQISQLKSEQTETLEREVKQRTQEVVLKNDLLESQNKEIIQSINYAQRLQDAILPSRKLLEAIFVNFDIYYRPKDIVSGDFYWFETTKDYTYFAVADCTGHGVPGALVSVVGYNALNRCINELNLTDPGEILDRLTILVEHTFDNADSVVSDGMDICLCRWDHKGEVVYSGAFNPLYVLREDDFEEVKADRQPIGKFIKRTPFTSNKVKVSEGDQIFLFTDGYLDQFGGERGKKLKSKGFKEHLLSTLEDKKLTFNESLDDKFIDWRGKEEQIDDVCILRVGF